MKAVVCQHAELWVDDLPAPVPAPGHVRLRVLRCGICGSDLHARTGADEWAEMAKRSGYHRFARADQPIVYGHEFCGEVAEHGPKTRGTVPTGTPAVALPLLRDDGIVDPTGLSQHATGAYAEQVLVQESLMLPVPNGLAPEVAALTEPIAVAWHAVRRGEVGKHDVAIVVGCGPVGLGVILMLKAKGRDHGCGQRLLAGAPGPGDGVWRRRRRRSGERVALRRRAGQGPHHDDARRARPRGEHAREARAATCRLVAPVAAG